MNAADHRTAALEAAQRARWDQEARQEVMAAEARAALTPPGEADAREFGLHVRQGGWRLGLLVARNVNPGTGQGARTDLEPLGDRPEVSPGKVSAATFAIASDTTHKRVLRYLRAWQLAAREGLVPPADALAPGDEVDALTDVHKLRGWREYYRRTGERTRKPPAPEAMGREVRALARPASPPPDEAVTLTLTPAERDLLAAALGKMETLTWGRRLSQAEKRTLHAIMRKVRATGYEGKQ